MILSVVVIIGEEIAYNQQKEYCFLRTSFTLPSQQSYPRDDVSKQLCLLATTSRCVSFVLLFSNPESSSIKDSTFNPDLSRLNTFFPPFLSSLFFVSFYFLVGRCGQHSPIAGPLPRWKRSRAGREMVTGDWSDWAGVDLEVVVRCLRERILGWNGQSWQDKTDIKNCQEKNVREQEQ